MRRWWARAAGGALALAAAACLTSLRPGVSGRVEVGPGSEGGLRAVYLGTGGWILEYGGETVLTAPLFTNPGLLRTGLLPIRADTAVIDRSLARYDVADALAILVGHAHYDHLMDVPRVAARHASRARVVGSRTVANTLGSWSGLAGRVDVVDDSAGDQRVPGRWLRYGRGVRVMALRSRHAPHFDGYTLYSGTRDTPRTTPPESATEWLDGQTFAYLIDFMDAPAAATSAADSVTSVGDSGQGGESAQAADSVAFRVYYQDAVAAPPAGFAPEPLIAERRVDVAIVVPATFDQVDWHPEALVENLNPRWMLLGHWEDFFVPVDAPTRSLRLADLGHFEARLARVFGGEFWRPDLWTELRFPRS